MEIKLLPKSVRETLRSEINIRSIPKCVAQLVFNSLDAKSASIAIRINLVSLKIQVIDNGNGISKKNLKLIGFRHVTSKYYSIEDLEKNPYIFPSRGESLASIIKLSQTVKITSSITNNSKTYCKTFENGKFLQITTVKQRPSKGTTIIIENFMYNLPVRKKSINQNSCLNEIKTEMEYIALIHPNVSFSLRDDNNGEIIFHSYRTKKVFQTTAILYGKEFSRRLRKIDYNNNRNFSVSGLISLDSHNQNKIQLIYINRRLVTKTKIHTLINTLISKSKIIKKEIKSNSPTVKQKYPAFILNIKCSYKELDIVDFIEPIIEFKNWEIILSCVENALIEFFKQHNLINTKETKNSLLNGSPLVESLPNVRTSQVLGVIRGIPMKRKLPEFEKIEQNLSISTNQTKVIPADVNNCLETFSIKSSEKIEQTLSATPKKIKKINIPKLKINKNEIQTFNQNLEKWKQEKETHNVSLETNSEYGKNLIMNMFLLSTQLYKTDDDISSKSLTYVAPSFKKCKTNITTSTKISVTKTIHHNIIQNNVESEDNIFKVPQAPKLKSLKRKKSVQSNSTVSNILAQNRISINEQSICKNFQEKFELDLLKNISQRNNIHSNVTNHVSKILNNFIREPKRNYECTIEIKKTKYLKSTDFLQPAKSVMRKFPAIKETMFNNNNNYYNNNRLPIKSKAMLKTFTDIKSNFNSYCNFKKYQNYEINNILPPKKYIFSNKNKLSSFSSSFKKEMCDNCLPIYNLKCNKYNKYIDNSRNKKNYYQESNTYVGNNYFRKNLVQFPSPVMSFKPYNTNPNLHKLFLKNTFQFPKHDLFTNFQQVAYKNVRNFKKYSDLKSNFSFQPTFNSHQYAEYSKPKNKQTCSKETELFRLRSNFNSEINSFHSEVTSETPLNFKNYLQNISISDINSNNDTNNIIPFNFGSNNNFNLFKCNEFIQNSKSNSPKSPEIFISSPITNNNENVCNISKINTNIGKETIQNVNSKNSSHASSLNSPIISRQSRFTNKNIEKSLVIEFEKTPNSNNSAQRKSSFSQTSNLIQNEEVNNILNILNESILYDELNGNKSMNIPVAESPQKLDYPVFLEDSTNIIMENTKNLDEILNSSLHNTTKENLNSKNSETPNNCEINLLYKNTEESNEINQNVTETENVNQTSEWIKHTSEIGNTYYLNSRTGMTSFETPKNVDGCLITKRPEFMPKGMSPILFNTSSAVIKELSPNSKNILHKTIANTEHDDLQTVKWINFLENKDSEQFFNDLYSNDKNYESEIPSLEKYKLPKKIISGFENYTFSREDFHNINVINQYDNKFIITNIQIQGKYNLIVLFDQHAVHERICLEKLLKDYEDENNKLKSIKCKSIIKLTLDDFEIKMLKNYKTNFEHWGLHYKIKDKANVIITSIPLCWEAKDDSYIKGKEFSTIESLILTLIQEESSWLRNIKTINIALPLVIQNTIKTEACRTAIKFGDPLSKEQCEKLMKELLLCDLPYNCAHGRPTLIPIIDLNHLINNEEEQINLNNLKI